MSAKLISVKNLSRHYGEHVAVNDISFELNKGDILGFLGPNGAGKSTTMQMLSGNLAPTQGEISINGFDLFEQPKQAKMSLGYLPDTPPLYKEMTVEEYLRFCAKLHRVNKSSISGFVDHTMQQCGLAESKKRLINNLSKGYQQRVGIAQAILHKPSVIILDEPTVGLDPIQIIEIRNLIKQLGRDHGVILCTHILPEVQAVCNRVQIIKQGHIVFKDSMDNFNRQDSDKFEVAFKEKVELSQLNSLECIQQAEKLNASTYLIQSSINAETLCQQLSQQPWGMKHFSQYSLSLEQQFTNLLSEEDSEVSNKEATA